MSNIKLHPGQQVEIHFPFRVNVDAPTGISYLYVNFFDQKSQYIFGDTVEIEIQV